MGSQLGDSRHRPADRGSTFVEALVALSLLAVACGGAVGPARYAASAFRRVSSLARTDRSLIQADELLRNAVGRVRFPPRAGALAVRRLPRGLRLGFLDGDPRRFLELGFRNGLLIVSDGLTSRQVQGFASASFRLLPGEACPNGPCRIPVVCALLESTGGECVEIYARVGSWPLLPALGALPGRG